MGNEIMRDKCPEKYCSKGSVIKNSIPTIIAVLLVAYFSGDLFKGSGMQTAVVIAIEVAVVVSIYGMFYLFMNGVKKRLAETYISVCENGICGVCPINGYKNREFSYTYAEVTKVTQKGERLFIDTASGRVVLTLTNATVVAELINGRKNFIEG